MEKFMFYEFFITKCWIFLLLVDPLNLFQPQMKPKEPESGNSKIVFQQVGMSYLHRSSAMTNTLFSPLSTMALLVWHLVACFMFGTGNPDLPLCRRLLPSIITKYPKVSHFSCPFMCFINSSKHQKCVVQGSITLYLRARLLLVSADVESAIYYFNKSIESQDLYKQFHHGCYWELL